jgi:hypothetical protein
VRISSEDKPERRGMLIATTPFLGAHWDHKPESRKGRLENNPAIYRRVKPGKKNSPDRDG